jgi:twinkle protein
MTPAELSTRLAQRVEAVCQELLPKGRRQGAEWEVGSSAGEEGKSLKVHLRGEKAGVWSDFATGQGAIYLSYGGSCAA